MIKYLILDVDGTLTDGSIIYDLHGNELKKFNTKDGTGINLTRAAGIKVVVITGRESTATEKRMNELHIDELFQNIKHKEIFVSKWMSSHYLERQDVGYIGDDLNDFMAMQLCGFIGCPSDANDEVLKIATIVSNVCGGDGVVRDIMQRYIQSQGLWTKTLHALYNMGI